MKEKVRDLLEKVQLYGKFLFLVHQIFLVLLVELQKKKNRIKVHGKKKNWLNKTLEVIEDHGGYPHTE